MPIIIENKTLAVIVAQEFILEESDRIHQKEKRDRYGFEEESFKNAIDGLPVISKERAAIISSFLQNCSQVISEVGYERVKQIEMNKELLNEIIEQDKLKTEFFANVSHELRTPLNVILGAIQVLNLIFRGSDEKLNRGKFEKYIYIIRQNCLRLLRLVNNLIDVTKIDSGYIQLNMRSIDIVKLVEDLIISVKEYVESKGMDFDFHTDIREKTMLCDMDKIERIMLNLISNAVKFSEAGDKITVKIEASDEKVIISVKDTGMGIPKEMQDRIFDRFVQAHKTIRRSHEGSGIGLTLAKSLVQMHGGNIWLHSELGKGSEFVFELPVVQDINTHQNVAESAASFEANLEKIQIEFSDI